MKKEAEDLSKELVEYENMEKQLEVLLIRFEKDEEMQGIAW